MDFSEALNQFKKNLEDSQTSDESKEITAAFNYYIVNGNNDGAVLETSVHEWSDKDLESLAYLLAPMAHPDWFYVIMKSIQEQFNSSGRSIEFFTLLSKIQSIKEAMDDEPYISPIDLSQRHE